MPSFAHKPVLHKR